MDKSSRLEVTKLITFSAEEIEVLRLEARWARAKLQGDGLHPRRVYEEERYEFVTEYMRGAEPAGSVKQQRWMRKIKRELRAMEERGGRQRR